MVTKLFVKSIFVISILVAITLFLLLNISMIEDEILYSEVMNFFRSKSSVTFDVLHNFESENYAETEKINKKILTNFLNQKGDFILYGDVSISKCIPVLVKGTPEIRFPMIKGRFFNKDDFTNKTNTAIIGKKLYGKCINKNGSLYIEHANTLYEVVGVYGYEKRNTPLDDCYFVNMSSYAKNNVGYYMFTRYIIDGNNAQDVVDNIGKQLALYNDKIIVAIDQSITDIIQSPLIKVLGQNTKSLFMMALVIIAILLNIVNVSSNWISKRVKEIAVHKLCGATNIMIARRIISEYQILSLFSFAMALIIYLSIQKFKILNIFFVNNLYIKSIIISLVLCMLFGLLTAFISIRMLFKVEISKYLK